MERTLRLCQICILVPVGKDTNQRLILNRVNKKNNKFTMGFDETSKANEAGAVESLVFSDKIFEKHDEDTVIEFLNQAEAKGVEVYAVDSTTDIGLRVSALGGIVSLLRFSPFG